LYNIFRVIHRAILHYFSLSLYVYLPSDTPYLISFPTRRSSDLIKPDLAFKSSTISIPAFKSSIEISACGTPSKTSKNVLASNALDRKSTRLNSSHVKISYAVFCLKKKKSHQNIVRHLHSEKKQN